MTQQNGLNGSPYKDLQQRQPARFVCVLSRLIALSLLFGLSACVPTAQKVDSIPTSEAGDSPEPKPEAAAPQTDPSVSAEPSGDSAVLDPPTERSNVLLIGPPGERQAALADCGSLETQSAMNLCAQQNYAQVDANLNEAYRALKALLPAGGEEALIAAETAWLQFRDRDCDFERSAFAGGSIAPLVYNTCLTARTAARTHELFYPELPEVSYQAADAQLNQTYQTLASGLSEDRRNDLSEVQLAWIEYRDRHCAYETLYGPNVIEKSQCLARMSAARTAQLQADLAQSSL